MNSINIMGVLVKDPQIKYLPSGSAIANFSIAVNQDYKKDGQTVKKTSFFECVSIGKQSEIINQYFSKGSRILITGSLNQETWQTNDGQNRSKVVIKVNEFGFVDRKSDNQSQQQQYQQPQQQVPEIDISSEEIPF